MMIAVGSVKASPGVTTLAALLAVFWPDQSRHRLVVEADPAGGSLAARWQSLGLSTEPGLLSLAATRASIDADVLRRHSQPIGVGCALVAAPPSIVQTAAALSTLGETGAAAISRASAEVDVILDAGRVDPAGPAARLLHRAALVILVCRPRLDEVGLVAERAAQLLDAGCSVELVTVGDRPYHPVEVAARCGVPLTGVVAYDRTAAARFEQDGPMARFLGRSLLGRSAAELASAVAARAPRLVPAPLHELARR